MAKITTEVWLSALIVVLTVLAIIVFIVNGAGIIFYGIFVVAAVVSFYTWDRIRKLEPGSSAAPASSPRSRKRGRRSR